MRTRHSFRPRVESLEDRAVPATFYVSTAGSNASSGDASHPWQTLQYAADRVRAGDTVIVRAGDYAGFHLATDGTASARITFTAESGARVTSSNSYNTNGINLEGASYVTVEGFAVVGVPRAGIRSVLNEGVVIRNNTCDQNGYWGIFTSFSYGVLIEGNVASRSVSEHGIYVSNSGDDPVVRGNAVWGNYANGIHMNGDVSQGGDGIISRALVEGNVLYGNGAGGGAALSADGVQDSVFRNNLVYDTHANGISLYRVDGGGASKNNLVVNNTLLVASDGRWAVNIRDGSTGNTVLNNVLHSAQSFRGAISVTADSLPGFVSDYNLAEDRFSTDGGNTAITLAQWRTATGQDGHSFTTSDPTTLFVSASGGDYHLTANSAAVDKGTTSNAPQKDAEGTARPSGAGVDIGHDEYASSPPPPPPPAPSPPTPPPPVSPPASPPTAARRLPALPIVVGAPVGTDVVRVLNPGGTPRLALKPHPGFMGGIVAAAGDVTGDGTPDVVTAATFGGHVKVFDGVTGAELRSFYGFAGYLGPINLAVGDVNGDGLAEVLISANLNGHVKVYDGATGVLTTSVFAYQGFIGAVALSAADLDGDGRAELITAADAGVGVHVKALVPATLALRDSFYATGPGNGTGFSVSAGDLDGDGRAEFVAAQGSRVRVLDSATKAVRADFFAFDPNARARVTVQAAQFDGDASAELVAIAEGAGRSHAKAFDGPGYVLAASFFADTR